MGIESKTHNLLVGATATGEGSNARLLGVKRTFQALGLVSSSTGAATIAIEASNDGTNFLVLGTITLTLGTTVTNDGFASDAAWRFVRANVTAISGTGATVSVIAGSEV